ncbi:MAG: hypothetical protein ACK4NN_10515, partial [Rheinheimera sp.]
ATAQQQLMAEPAEDMVELGQGIQQELQFDVEPNAPTNNEMDTQTAFASNPEISAAEQAHPVLNMAETLDLQPNSDLRSTDRNDVNDSLDSAKTSTKNQSS